MTARTIRRVVLGTALAATLGSASCGRDDSAAAARDGQREGWTLVWSDEFDGDGVDGDNWTYDIGGWGWGNGEAQYYTDRPENARTEDGLLIIEARQENYSDPDDPDGSPSYYTSARLKTQDRHAFRYGRIEARIKVPAGAGLWPAFWMLGDRFDPDSQNPQHQWPNVGEIDIMEYIGKEPDIILGTAHGPGYSGALGLTSWHNLGVPVAEDFHTYAIEWRENSITWFVDDVEFHRLTPEVLQGREWVFNQEFFIILNLAVGGQLPGPVDLNLEFPVQYHIDYVRVYQENQESEQ